MLPTTAHPKPVFDAQRDELVALAAGASSVESLFASVSGRLHEILPYDAACWFSSDPATLFASWPVRIENVQPGHCDTYWEREFIVDDALLFRELARGPRTTGTLRSELDGLMARSTRYREFMAPQGFEDELRTTLRIGEATWGLIEFLRYGDSEPFTVEESAFIASLSRPLAEAVRTKLLTQRATINRAQDDPGLLTYDATGQLLSSNDAAQFWLDQLPNRSLVEEIPVAVSTVLAHARAVAFGHAKGAAELRVPSRSGRWLTLRASVMREIGGGINSITVLIEPANGSQLAPILAEAYGLSKRELEVAQSLARGLSTATIAATLYLSEHTVRDHVKAILGKVGVSSRGELVASLFFEHVAPHLHRPDAHF